MKPYFDDGQIVLYHGDALEVLEWLEADVLVTDPPYGMDYRSNYSKYNSPVPIAGDGDIHLRDKTLELWGPTKGALVFGTWRVERPSHVRQLIIWDKGETPGMGDLSLPWGPSHEDIYALGKTGFRGKREGSVIRVKTLGAMSLARPDHPTPKPVGLMELLLNKTTGVIADPFAGSGSTLVAARNLGRPAIGVEIEERYCEITAKRLAQGVFDFGEIE